MGGSSRVPDPGGVVNDATAGIVRWEPPETSDEVDVGLPAFVPGLVSRDESAPTTHEPERFEPGADRDWKFEPVREPPPPAPKGQWWAAWLPDPRQRHEFRYWDGTNWTDHVSDAGLAGIDPV